MRALALLLLLVLAACSDADEADVPGPTVTPQTIGYPDIEANELYGASCAYASGTSMAPIAIAFPEEAVMKIDGAIHRFRVDEESEGSQLGEDSRYLAQDRVLLLTIAGEGTPAGEETANFTGTVRLIDGAGAELFATEGTVQCGS
jgi:hypothetical protein